MDMNASGSFDQFPQKAIIVIHLHQYDLQCIQAAHMLLSKDPLRRISIEGLALEVGLNRTKLQYGFKQLYGTNIYDFMVQKRMEKARELLLTSQKPVKTIAVMSGYSNGSSFVSVFKRLHGITPLQYRKLAQR